MFKSKFLPVKILSASEASVHTAETIYPWSLLQQAHDHLTGTAHPNVIIKNNNVCFASHPDIRWFMFDVVNAYETFSLAQQNKFSFYPIYDSKGTVSLYVSSVFNQSRLLVNAYTMSTVIVTKPQLIRKLSSMVDQKYSAIYLMDIFYYATRLEKNSRNFLDGWIVNPERPDGYVTVNPLTALYSDTTLWYAIDTLTEMERVVSGECTETESYRLENNLIVRTDMVNYPGMTVDWCRSIVELWHKLESRNRSFVQLDDVEEKIPLCYCSTDLHHVVDAATGECVSVKNKSFREMLRKCLEDGGIMRNNYRVLWDCLRTHDRV